MIPKIQLVSLFFIGFILTNCKTITIQDNYTYALPDDIELIKIPAGNYTIGENNEVASIDYDYSIMKFPVTNEQYVEYLIIADSLGLISIDSLGVYGYYSGDKFWPPDIYKFADFTDQTARIGFYPPDAYFTRWRYVDNKKEYYHQHPITHVTWFGANAFAEFYGMRLPTTQEWEKAARANTGYDYPWGDELSSNRANYKNNGDVYDNDTTPVGYFNGENDTYDGYSPYGVYDMAGNVWEWTASWWRDSSGRLFKGGSFNSSLDATEDSGKLINYSLMTWFETAIGFIPSNDSREIGFRCVKE